MSTDLISIAVSIVALAIAIAAAAASWVQVREMKRQWREQSQPYVYGEFTTTYQGALLFVLQNRGNSPAFTVEARLEAGPDGVSEHLLKASLFSSNIRFFPPGDSYRVFAGMGPELLGRRAKAPNCTLELSYQTADGRIISDRIEYDLSYLSGALIPPATEADRMGEIARHLSAIKDVLKSRQQPGAHRG